MDFKKKAGLALALAAIFTTGGANVAFAQQADCVTHANGGNVSSDEDTAVFELTGSDTPWVTIDAGVEVSTKTILAAETTATEATLTTADSASKVTVTSEGGNIAVNGAGQAIDLIVAGAGTLELAGTGALDAVLELRGTATLAIANATDSASFAIAELVATSGNKILVGDDSSADGQGALDVAVADLNGAAVFVDPLFTPGEYKPSTLTVEEFSDAISETITQINGKVIGGQNSTITIGDSNTVLVDRAIEDTNKWHALFFADATANETYTAALALVGPQTLLKGAGALYVDGGSDTNADIIVEGSKAAASSGTVNTAFFGDNSLAVFDLTGVSKTVAALAVHTGSAYDVLDGVTIGETAANVNLTNPDTTTQIDAGAYFHNAQAGKLYTIFADVTTGALKVGAQSLTENMTKEAVANAMGDHWNGNDLNFSSGLLGGYWTVDATNDDADTNVDLILNVARNAVDVQTLFPAMSNGMEDMVDELYTVGQNYTFFNHTTGQNTFVGNQAGIAFVSRVTDNEFIGERDASLAASTLEGAAQIAVAGGVPYLTSNIIGKISSLIVDHNNILNDTQPAYGNEPGQVGIWVTPFYSMGDVDGMDAGRFQNGFELNYGGAAFGLDYNVNEAFRLGVALNLGSGDTDSDDGDSDFNRTENDFDFFGATLYGSWTNGAFGLTGDLGYTSVDNEITQKTPADIFMGNLESDVDSDAFTVGLTGKYRFTAGDNLGIAPHLGLRYTKISVDDADVRLAGGGRVFDTVVEDQNLFQIPLGVEFSSQFVTDGGWTVTPKADLGVLFTMGDTDVDTRARIAGTGFSTGTMNADVVDSAAFTGTLGVKAAADNGLSLGLDYGILASGNQTDHQFTGMLRFEF